MSGKNGSDNGKNNGNPVATTSYSAAAGLGTADNSVNDTSASVATQVNVPTSDAAPNVGEPINHNKVEGGKGGAGRTILKGVGLFVAVIIVGAVAAYFMFLRGDGARVVKTTVRNQAVAGQDLSVSDEKLTADAIARTRGQLAPSDTNAAPVTPPTIIVQQPSETVVPTRVGTTTLNANGNVNASAEAPVVRPAEGVAGTVNANANASTNTSRTSLPSSGGGSSQTRTTGERAVSKANGQKSMIFGEDEAGADSEAGASRGGQSRAVNGGFAIGSDNARGNDTQFAPVRPSFGSLLPVRTLGAIYTLRSGALVRMELTRDVGGQGWKLPRRTAITVLREGT